MRGRILLLIMVLVSVAVGAVESPWTPSSRMAISADGNPDADADDVGATPFTLAMLAKAGLKDNLVHYDFNNFLNYKRIEPEHNRMWKGAMGGQARWGFDAGRFFDASIDPDGAINHLAGAINTSTADDPLYLIVAGPMELIFQALEKADPITRQHVIIVSHHNYNEYFKARLWQRNWNDVKELVPNIGYLRIKDQNGWGGNGLKGKDDSDFNWLRDHSDPNLNWVYERIVAGKPDVSDVGMVSWLIGLNGEDQMISIQDMQAWFGDEPVPTYGESKETPEAPAAVTPHVVPPKTEKVFQEVDGRLVIEAESVPLSRGWKLEDGYIQWLPNREEPSSHQHQGELMYKLRISNPGKYRMALKSAHAGDAWNSCWTVMGLNPVNPYGITRNTGNSVSADDFIWDTAHKNYGSIKHKEGEMSDPVYELEAGDHYFWICGRSRGFQIDKIHFFNEGTDGFTDDSIAATPVVSE